MAPGSPWLCIQKGPDLQSLELCFPPNARVGGMSTKPPLQGVFSPLAFPPKHTICPAARVTSRQGVPHGACEVDSPKQQRMNAVVKREETRLGCVPGVQLARGMCDSCFGRPFHTSPQLCCVSHACRAVSQGSAQPGLPGLQLLREQPSSTAGQRGRGAGGMLGCTPGGGFCTGKLPKIHN